MISSRVAWIPESQGMIAHGQAGVAEREALGVQRVLQIDMGGSRGIVHVQAAPQAQPRQLCRQRVWIRIRRPILSLRLSAEYMLVTCSMGSFDGTIAHMRVKLTGQAVRHN